MCSAEEQEKRLAMIAVVVENYDSVEKLNRLLHENGQYIIGRTGIPCRDRGVSLISVAMDAPSDVISSLSGKLGMLPGVSAKAVYAKAPK
ncbi:MAG: iron-only hydrogenase system regulator [Clostridiales bacterium]|nr:iron-only hydrogenase system regulator [Clostridiales bacterium]